MLSNPRLTPFTMANPLTTLVIDEASQIEVGDYVAVFTRYVFSLRKLCFIGDDKQCKSTISSVFILLIQAQCLLMAKKRLNHSRVYLKLLTFVTQSFYWILNVYFIFYIYLFTAENTLIQIVCHHRLVILYPMLSMMISFCPILNILSHPRLLPAIL